MAAGRHRINPAGRVPRPSRYNNGKLNGSAYEVSDMLKWQWLIGPACLLSAGADPSGPRWLSDYAQALELARAEGKPLFVVFRCEH